MDFESKILKYKKFVFKISIVEWEHTVITFSAKMVLIRSKTVEYALKFDQIFLSNLSYLRSLKSDFTESEHKKPAMGRISTTSNEVWPIRPF
jgi:hypothetical protein